MTRRTKEDWLALINEQAASGQSASQYCKDKNINPKYFSLKKSQLSGDTTKPTKPKFHPIAISTLNQTIQLEHPHFKMSFPVSLEPAWLARFVKEMQ